MKFISLGTIDRQFLIPVVGGIIRLIYLIFINYSPKIGIINQNPFIECIYITIAMSLTFIPFLIIKQKSKATMKTHNEQITNSFLYRKLIDNKNVFKKTIFKKYKFIAFSSVFDTLDILLTILFTQYL